MILEMHHVFNDLMLAFWMGTRRSWLKLMFPNVVFLEGAFAGKVVATCIDRQAFVPKAI